MRRLTGQSSKTPASFTLGLFAKNFLFFGFSIHGLQLSVQRRVQSHCKMLGFLSVSIRSYFLRTRK